MSEAWLGRYELQGLIGRGGMGSVYKAHDTRLGRIVALKVMDSTLGIGMDAVARFEREGQSLALLQHPNIVTIYDFMEVEGNLCLVMELIEGKPLDVLICEKTPLTVTAKLNLMAMVCRALDYAHAKGIVHRDLKPSNILVQPNNSPKIVDFGIAKIMDSQMTVASTLIGTVAYMSPEQVNGDKVTHQTDIYSAGLVLYELLTGARAFEGNTATTIRRIMFDPTPSIPVNIPNIPQSLHSILERALARDPAQRYATAGEFADALERCVAPPATVNLSEAVFESRPASGQPEMPHSQPPYQQPHSTSQPQSTPQPQYPPQPQPPSQQYPSQPQYASQPASQQYPPQPQYPSQQYPPQPQPQYPSQQYPPQPQSQPQPQYSSQPQYPPPAQYPSQPQVNPSQGAVYPGQVPSGFVAPANSSGQKKTGMLAASAFVLLLLIGGIGYELFHSKSEPKPDHASVATPVPTPIDKPNSTNKPTPIDETASTDKTVAIDKPTPADKVVPADKTTSTNKPNPIDKPNSANKPISTDKPAPIERTPVAHSPMAPVETNPAPPVDKTKSPEPERKATPPIASVPFTLAGQVPVGSVVVQVGAVPQQESAELLLMALRQKGYTLVARHQPIQDHLFHIQSNPLGDEKEAAALRQRLVHDGFNPVIYRAKECSGHLLCWTNLTPSN